MFAQFQSQYPKGCLVSELVQIYNGKYIVRVSVQVEGTTLATAMAQAEILEQAEDNARERVFTLLGIQQTPVAATPQQPVLPLVPSPTTTAKPSSDRPSVETPKQTATKIQNDSIEPDFGQNFTFSNQPEPKFSAPPVPDFEPEYENNFIPEHTTSNVTPFPQRSYTAPEEESAPAAATGNNKRKKKGQPIDLSDIIAKTDVELQRLGWSPEQGREHLIKTYNKRGRTLLTEDELLSFLKYLETQPTPVDPLAGF